MKNLRKAELFMHHIMAGSLAYAALHPYAHAYAPFFFGVVEISSVFLTSLEVIELFPDFMRRHKLLHACVQGLFAVSFILIRLIAWPILLMYFWPDNYAVVLTGKISSAPLSKRPHTNYNELTGQAHSLFVIALYVVSCAGLTFLQFKWGMLIITAIHAALFKSKNK